MLVMSSSRQLGEGGGGFSIRYCEGERMSHWGLGTSCHCHAATPLPLEWL